MHIRKVPIVFLLVSSFLIGCISNPEQIEEPPVWSPEVIVLETIQAEQIIWSPNANQFLYQTCPPDLYMLDDGVEGGVVRVDLADTPSHSLIVQAFICSGFGSSIAWVPDGERVLFTAPSREEVDELGYVPDTADIWLVEPTGEPQVLLGRDKILTRWAPQFHFWIDDEIVLYSGYSGGGHTNSALLNIQDERRSQSITLHACALYGFSRDFLFGCTGASQTSRVSALAIPLEALRRTTFDVNDDELAQDEFFLSSPSQTYLSYDQEPLQGSREYNSHSLFVDWLPNTNQILALTWDSGLDLEDDAPVETQLQLWDMDDGSLDLIAPRGKHGRFSPDGRFLAYVDGDDHLFTVHLLDMETRAIQFSQPEWVTEQFGQVATYFSFSADGRYFTSLAPDAESDSQGKLTVYDLSDGDMVVTFPAQQMEPIWSPESDQFVYKNRYGALAVYQLASDLDFAITENNDTRVSAPQWSFDGLYLSVRIAPDRTVILGMP